MKTAKSDPVLSELWQAKDALAKRFHYDIHQLAAFLRQEESKPQSKTPARPRRRAVRSTVRKAPTAR